MRILSKLAIVSLLFLAACSNSGSGNNGAQGDGALDEFLADASPLMRSLILSDYEVLQVVDFTDASSYEMTISSPDEPEKTVRRFEKLYVDQLEQGSSTSSSFCKLAVEGTPDSKGEDHVFRPGVRTPDSVGHSQQTKLNPIEAVFIYTKAGEGSKELILECVDVESVEDIERHIGHIIHIRQ